MKNIWNEQKAATRLRMMRMMHAAESGEVIRGTRTMKEQSGSGSGSSGRQQRSSTVTQYGLRAKCRAR